MASPSSGAPALKYGDVNTVTPSLGEVKGLKRKSFFSKKIIWKKKYIYKEMKVYSLTKIKWNICDENNL